MRRLFSVLAVFVFAFFFVVSSLAYSQESPTGSLVGTVTDPQGAAIIGAKITVTDMTGGSKVSTESGEGGHFTVATLGPANYYK